MYKPIKPGDIPASFARMDDQIVKDVQDFMETSYAAAEITIPKGKTAKCLCASYRKVVEKLGFKGRLTILMRKERLFMLKEAK